MDDNLRITIRGLDADTKSTLVKNARQEDVSLNKYVLTSLKQAAGTETSVERYQRMKHFLDKNRIPDDEIKRINEAIKWGNRASLKKQRQDERDLGL